MEQDPHALDASQPECVQPNLAEDLRLLADEAKAFAQAELAFQKARAAYAGRQMRTVAILLALALVLAFFAVLALVVGLVIALGPVLTPWGAVAFVTLLLLALAGTCAIIARSTLGAMQKVIADRPEAPGGEINP